MLVNDGERCVLGLDSRSQPHLSRNHSQRPMCSLLPLSAGEGLPGLHGLRRLRGLRGLHALRARVHRCCLCGSGFGIEMD